MYFNQKIINYVRSHYQTNIIDSFATFNDGFNLKIKRDSFSDKYQLFIPFPNMKKLSILAKLSRL